MGPALEKSIDSTGGSLTSADGRLTITVPPGAVSSETTFSIRPVTSMAPSAIGVSYSMSAHNAFFSQPVTLSFEAPEAGVSRTSLSGLGIAMQEESGSWRLLADPQRDDVNKVISASSAFLFSAAIVEELQILPLMASVREGTTVDLTVAYCVATDSSKPNLVGLLYECSPTLTPLQIVTDWAVNTIPGGNSILGTVSGYQNTGKYTAPANRPSPPTVRVQVHVGPHGKAGEAYAFSELTIGTPGNYNGTIDVSSTGFEEYTARGNMEVTPHIESNGQISDSPDYTVYDIKGTLSVDQSTVKYFGHDCLVKDKDALISTTIIVRKYPPAQAWSLAAQWPLSCTDGTSTVDTKLELWWKSSCDNTSNSLIPLADPNHLEGCYFFDRNTCKGVNGTTQVIWDFKQKY